MLLVDETVQAIREHVQKRIDSGTSLATGDDFTILSLCDEVGRLRAALREIAGGSHGFRRPAGTIARAALEGKPLPEWDR